MAMNFLATLRCMRIGFMAFAAGILRSLQAN